MTWLRGPWLPRLFVGLYLLIGLATLRHSAYGFASIESGNIWLGLLSAVAVDVLMILFAHGLRDGWRWDYAGGLAIPAALSIYTQLLFAVSEAHEMTVSPGAEWLGASQDILRWRIILLPAALPILALVASLAGRGNKMHVSLKAHQNTIARLTDTRDELRKATEALEPLRQELETLKEQSTSMQIELNKAQRELAASSLLRHLPDIDKARILAGSVGDNGGPRTNKDLAKFLGVSESTVSRALAKMRERDEHF